MLYTAYTAEVTPINDPEAIVSVELTLNDYGNKEPIVIDMTEEIASKIAFQIANVLQDIAKQRSDKARDAADELNEQKRIAAWKRTQQFKKSINTLQELR